MVVTQGSGSSNLERASTNDKEICRIIVDEVVVAIREAITEMFGSINTKLIKTFDKCYNAVTEATAVAATTALAAATPHGCDSLMFQEFNNMKPPEFNGTQDPIDAMRWISNIEGCFYTCSCYENLKVRFALNQLCLGTKDWWKFVTTNYSPADHATVTWDRFTQLSRDKFVPQVEREQLSQERALFYLEHVSNDQARMRRYLSTLRRDI